METISALNLSSKDIKGTGDTCGIVSLLKNHTNLPRARGLYLFFCSYYFDFIQTARSRIKTNSYPDDIGSLPSYTKLSQMYLPTVGDVDTKRAPNSYILDLSRDWSFLVPSLYPNTLSD